MSEELRWDLTELYPGPEGPELAADFERLEALARKFESEYRGRINVVNLPADLLVEALHALEEILELRWKLSAYSYLLYSLDTRDAVASALHTKVEEVDAAAIGHLIFFDLEWQKVPEEQAQALINAPELSRWRYYLHSLRLYIPHTLSEPEEKVLNELSPVAGAWATHFKNIIGRITVGGKPLSQALSECSYDPDRRVRQRAYRAITRALKREAQYIVDVINTVLLDGKITAGLRRYKGPMAPRNLHNGLNESAVAALLDACDANTELVARYYQLKRRISGIPRLSVYDRYAPLSLRDGEDVTLDEAREIILAAYSEFSPEVGTIATRFFEESWVDAPATPGKMGGAYALGIPFLHPFIFMNWTGKAGDVLTLAHELGHGIHDILYALLSLLECHPPMVLAETASVFGEQLVFARLLAGAETPEEKLALLCQELESAFATSFRQAAITRFEQRIHAARAEGELSIEEINTAWLETQRAMFDSSVAIPDSYGWWWVYISHLLRPFYCYSYSFGQLLVLALYGQYQEQGEAFIPGYLDLLRAGGSDSPANLLKKHVGVDVEDPAFWQKGMGILEEMVEEAEELARQLGY
jgi:oligoendopeptidase F